MNASEFEVDDPAAGVGSQGSAYGGEVVQARGSEYLLLFELVLGVVQLDPGVGDQTLAVERDVHLVLDSVWGDHVDAPSPAET